MQFSKHRSVKGLIVAAVGTVIAAGAGIGWHPPVAGAAGNPYYVFSNQPYCTLNGVTELADIYVPNPLPSSPMPVVLYFHGGTDGNYKGGITSAAPRGQSALLNALTANGYEVISFNWYSTSSDQYPDTTTWKFAKCAVRTVRANASGLDIDPHRIAAWGDSNGGGIASILGTAGPAQGWDVGPYLSYSSRVEAVVDWFGATSGLPYVGSGDSPFLFQQGTADTNVPPSLNQLFNSTLQRAGNYSQIQLVQNAMHEFIPVTDWSTGLPMAISPSLGTIAQQAVSFLNTEMKNNPNPEPQ